MLGSGTPRPRPCGVRSHEKVESERLFRNRRSVERVLPVAASASMRIRPGSAQRCTVFRA